MILSVQIVGMVRFFKRRAGVELSWHDSKPLIEAEGLPEDKIEECNK